MALPSTLPEGGLWLAFGIVAGLVYLPSAGEQVGAVTALHFAVQGMLVMGLLFASERAVRDSRLADRLAGLPFLAEWAAHNLISIIVIMVALGVGNWLLAGSAAGSPGEAPPLGDLVYSVSMAALFHIVLLARATIGGRVLLNALLGRYRRPLDERRIFLVLDLIGSTELAGRLGDHRMHRLLSSVFADVAAITGSFGGETHAYIGDQAIVTWPMSGDGVLDARSVACSSAILEMMARRRPWYQARFGHVPHLRMTLHGGPVVAGECGMDRRQIVYSGDAIITAVRLQDVSKSSGCTIVASGDLLDQIVLPEGCRASDLGVHSLRGRLATLRVAALEVSSDRCTTPAALGPTPSWLPSS